MVTAVGPAALLRPSAPPSPAADERVRVDTDTVDRMAELIADSTELRPFDFTGELFPDVGDPATVEWFAAATLQQFGFWHARDGAWAASMIATIDGVERKGSDYLWAAYRRWERRVPDATSPPRQASLTLDEWHAVVADDTGNDPFPRPSSCVALANAFGRTLGSVGPTASELVEAAAATARPMRSLLSLLDHIGGYREDPLRKKSALLGVILRQRPEHALPGAPDDDAPPIVDYHVQRTCLRTGLVVVDDPDLVRTLRSRHLVTPAEEDAVRRRGLRGGRGARRAEWQRHGYRRLPAVPDAPPLSRVVSPTLCGVSGRSGMRAPHRAVPAGTSHHRVLIAAAVVPQPAAVPFGDTRERRFIGVVGHAGPAVKPAFGDRPRRLRGGRRAFDWPR